MSTLSDLVDRVSALATHLGNSLQLRGFKEGGTAGQVPTKVDGTDFNWTWQDPASGAGDALTSGTLDQFADVVQAVGATLTITANATISGTNTGDQDLSAYALTSALHASATVTGNGISIAGQQISLSIGTGATQVAAGDHTHAGVYEPADGTILKDADIGSTVQGYSAVLATTTASFLTAQETKLGHISVTQAVDLDQMETDIAALANGMVYKDDWDASSGTFPGAGAAQIGWFYNVSVAGTVDGVAFAIGDSIIAKVDNASTTTYAGNWVKKDQTDAVQTVAGRVGNVVITSSDLADFSSAADARVAASIGISVQAYSAILAGTTASFTTTLETKLNGIEAGADVTDTANVTAAGALMDSEVTDLAGIKGVTISTLQVKPVEGAFANGDKTKLDGIEAAADVTDAGNVGSSIHGAAAKTTPVDADTVPLIDSAAANALKKLSWLNIKATLKTYFDTLYALAAHSHEGTAILSTGEVGATKFLREDGDGTCSWQTIAGGGDLLAANNLSELTGTASTARANLGLTIGTHVQAYDADLTTWAGITPGANVGTALAVAVGSAGAFATNNGQIQLEVGNGVDVITTGVKRYFRIPYGWTITGAYVTASPSGSIVFDIWKDTVSTDPETDVTVADTITASAKPTLSSDTYSADTTLTGWTTTGTAGQWMAVKVDSASTVTKAMLTLSLTRA